MNAGYFSKLATNYMGNSNNLLDGIIGINKKWGLIMIFNLTGCYDNGWI
jgi:hypothetical protein